MIGLESGYGDYLFISHAHSDHIRPIKKRKLLSSEFTAKLVYNIKPAKKLKNIEYHNAGHIPGSLQISIDTDGGKIVYTGDIKLSSRGSIKGADVVECDYLIIESTYARMVHPSYDDVVHNFKKFMKKKGTKIIGAYPVGKAQEIIMLLNEQGTTPIVTEKIHEVNKLCSKKIDYVVAGTDYANEIIRDDFVAILPPSKINRELAVNMSVAFNKKIYTVGITAQPWAVYKYDKVFPISDHADKNELIEYVERANPKMILTTHGDDIYFANLLRKKGYNAITYSKLKR